MEMCQRQICILFDLKFFDELLTLWIYDEIKFYGNMLRESFSPRAGSAVKESAAKAASMLKEGGMVGRATGQGYGAARKGPNVVW